MHTEDDRIVQLLGQLGPELRPESTVDIERILASGRRRQRLRAVAVRTTVAVLVGTLAGVALVGTQRRAPGPQLIVDPQPTPSVTQAAQPAPPPTSCVAQVLPAPVDGQHVTVTGIDPSGHHLVGWSTDESGRYHPLLWTDGQLTVLDPDGSYAELDGLVVNQAGVVFWSGSTAPAPDNHDRVWRYDDGAVTEVARATGYRVMAVDSHGGIVAVDQGPTTGWHVKLLQLPADGPATVRDLQALDPIGPGRVLAVDADGTAVGLADVRALPIGAGAGRAVIWPADGGMRILDPPPGYEAAVATVVHGGWVGGAAWRTADPHLPPAGQPVSVLWDPGAGVRRLPAPLWWTGAINGYGWLTGTDLSHKPVLAAGDHVVSLPVPAGPQGAAGAVDPGAVDPGTRATVLSDDARVIAGQAVLVDKAIALRWTCS
jgi:hypothetical protein